MKSNAAIDREIQAVLKQINYGKGPLDIGVCGTTKYQVAFAIFRTLRWARGQREEYPSIELAKLKPEPRP